MFLLMLFFYVYLFWRDLHVLQQNCIPPVVHLKISAFLEERIILEFTAYVGCIWIRQKDGVGRSTLICYSHIVTLFRYPVVSIKHTFFTARLLQILCFLITGNMNGSCCSMLLTIPRFQDELMIPTLLSILKCL